MNMKKEMRRSGDRQIVAGLDIGTSKIGVVIGEVQGEGRIQILGVGMSPSKGLRQGTVINLDEAVRSIQRAVEEAQLTAGLEVHSVTVGIAGDHVRSVNSRGVVAVSRSEEITQRDVERVIDAAKAIALPVDREVIHVLPQEFIVDNQGGIKTPIGISGVRLEAEIHIVTGAITSSQNIIRCVKKAGLHVNRLALEPLASSYAILDQDEKDLGVALVDLGAGTTDIALFHDGAIRHTAVIGLGGQNITNDIALGLRTPLDKAEELKIKYGSAYQNAVTKKDMFTVPGLGGRAPREVSREVLSSIIQPRMEEIFSLVSKEMKRSDFGDLLGAGVVLTGGCALLADVAVLAEEIFGLPVKVGVPKGFSGLVESASSPVLSTGVGLVLYGAAPGEESMPAHHEEEKKGWADGLWDKIVKYYEEFIGK